MRGSLSVRARPSRRTYVDHQIALQFMTIATGAKRANCSPGRNLLALGPEIVSLNRGSKTTAAMSGRPLVAGRLVQESRVRQPASGRAYSKRSLGSGGVRASSSLTPFHPKLIGGIGGLDSSYLSRTPAWTYSPSVGWQRTDRVGEEGGGKTLTGNGFRARCETQVWIYVPVRMPGRTEKEEKNH